MTFLFVMIVTRPCFSNSINSGGGAKKESPRSLPQASYFQHTHTSNRVSSYIAPLDALCVTSEVFLGWIRKCFLSPLRPPPPEIPWGTYYFRGLVACNPLVLVLTVLSRQENGAWRDSATNKWIHLVRRLIGQLPHQYACECFPRMIFPRFEKKNTMHSGNTHFNSALLVSIKEEWGQVTKNWASHFSWGLCHILALLQHPLKGMLVLSNVGFGCDTFMTRMCVSHCQGQFLFGKYHLSTHLPSSC